MGEIAIRLCDCMQIMSNPAITFNPLIGIFIEECIRVLRSWQVDTVQILLVCWAVFTMEELVRVLRIAV